MTKIDFKWACTTCKREFLSNEELPIDEDGTCESCFGQAEAWYSERKAHMEMKYGGISNGNAN